MDRLTIFSECYFKEPPPKVCPSAPRTAQDTAKKKKKDFRTTVVVVVVDKVKKHV